MDTPLTDRQGRRITYLRMSVTDRCNLRCCYCMPSEGRRWIPHEHILCHEELIRLARILALHGVEKIRLTGGEPLIRKNLTHLIAGLKALPGIREVSMTTNGILLAENASALKGAGIDRINVSLDSLKPGVFSAITGKDRLHAVLSGIEAARCAGMSPVKINVVPMAGINDAEVEDLAALSFGAGMHVRFIEEMPMGMRDRPGFPSITMDEVIRRVESRWGRLIPVLSHHLDGPARRFRIPGAGGEVGFIPAMTRHFCATCNRIRLTASGRIRPCLMDEEGLDLRMALRNGADDEMLYALLKRAVSGKGVAHAAHPHVATGMVSIGG